jgi:molybdopterin adenylyltransferase
MEMKGCLYALSNQKNNEATRFLPYLSNYYLMNPEHVQALTITIGVITISSSRDMNTDSSGKIIISLCRDAGYAIEYYQIVPDRINEIRDIVRTGMQTCNCLILNGGTGLTHDDCTIEAIEPLYEKKIDGFGELFRLKSYEEIGPSAMLSRASAGIIQQKVIFCIPGSNGAVTLAVSTLIIPEIRHILSHARK